MATSSSPMVALVGETVIDSSGAEHSVADLAGENEYFGLLFSAQWCPPCRAFCPVLKEFYKTINAKKAGSLEIIYVSSDRSEDQFSSYFGEMPWKAIAYSDEKRRGPLGAKFGVRGIPALVIVNKNGELVTDKARQNVSSDPEGAGFPWKPRTAMEELKADDCSLVARDGSDVSADAVVAHKYLGLYFSAHWCPPCKAFTPVLAAWYTKMKERGEDLEIVFVSGDRSKGDFDEYLAEMPWPAISFDRRDVATRLNGQFEVRGIPSLILLDTETGKAIVSDGRARVSSDGDAFPWPPKPVEPLPNAMEHINSKKTAVLFVDKMTDGAAMEKVQAALEAVAKSYFPADSDKIIFTLADDDEVTAGLRQQTGLGRDRDGPKAAKFVVYDVAAGGLKYVLDTAGELPTEDSIRAFVQSVLDGSAKGVSLRS